MNTHFHRLKINDISDAGNQPLIHPNDYNLSLICNGEIYNWKSLAKENNFKTKSTSDCEIILHMCKKYGIETELIHLNLQLYTHQQHILVIYAHQH